MNGVVIIDKPEGVTSRAVVSIIKNITGEKKAGHGGTLDPMATGVLPVMVGNAVGASDYIMAGDKRYLAGIDFGYETDTEDSTGTVISRYERPEITLALLERACRDFCGDIMQTPPMYSALKVGGRKLCDLARKGIDIQREQRRITVFSIVPEERDGGFYLRVHCGKGTYIRTLCADIGRSLGCGAVMSSLRRLSAGMFSVENAVTPEGFAAMDACERERVTIPCSALFPGFATVYLTPECERLFRNGVHLTPAEAPLPGGVGDIFRVCGENGFFALGECVPHDGEPTLKVKKFFL